MVSTHDTAPLWRRCLRRLVAGLLASPLVPAANVAATLEAFLKASP